MLIIETNFNYIESEEESMHLYRRTIPSIARDIIRELNFNKLIEVDADKIGEAELDISAVIVEHMNAEDRVSKEAVTTMIKRGLSDERFFQVKKSVADARGLKLGEEGVDFILNQILEVLFSSSSVAEIFADDNKLRLAIKNIISKYINTSEDISKEARMRLKNIKEGSSDWEIEYPRIVAQIKRQRGLI